MTTNLARVILFVYASVLAYTGSADMLINSPVLGTVVTFNEAGDCIVHGEFFQNVTNTTTQLADESGKGDFIVRNAQGSIVARVDPCLGRFYIAGTVTENDESLESISPHSFVIKGPNGSTLAAIDDTGNLRLAADLVELGDLCDPEGECSCD